MSSVLPTDSLPITLPYQPMRMSVATYHRLIANGSLTKDQRVELLQGVLVEKMTHNPLHAGVILALQTLLLPLLPPGFLFRCQLPITLDDSEPEPDISIARGGLEDYWTRHPGAADVPLVIEISSSTLVTDRFKAEIYAAAGLPIYWIVNLVDRRIEVRTAPGLTAAGPRYAECRHYSATDNVPVSLAGLDCGLIPAAKLFPAK